MSNTLITKFLGKAQTRWNHNLHHHPTNNSNMLDANQALNLLWIGQISPKGVITTSLSTLCSPASIQMKCTSNMKSKSQVSHVHAQDPLRELMNNTLTAIKRVSQLVDGWQTKPFNLILHSIATKVGNRKTETSSREILVKPNLVSLFVKYHKMSTQNNCINLLNQVPKQEKRWRALQQLLNQWKVSHYRIKQKPLSIILKQDRMLMNHICLVHKEDLISERKLLFLI